MCILLDIRLGISHQPCLGQGGHSDVRACGVPIQSREKREAGNPGMTVGLGWLGSGNSLYSEQKRRTSDFG